MARQNRGSVSIDNRSSEPPLKIYWVGIYYYLAFSSFGIFLPYLPAWLEARHITGIEFGAVVAMRPLTSIVSPVLFGIVADRFGIRGSLLVVVCTASALTMAAIAGLGVLPGSLGFVPVFALLGVFSFFRSPVVSVADVTAMEGKQKGYGTVRLWGSLGFLVAALIGGIVLDTTSEIALPATIAVAMAGSALVALKLPRGLAARPPSSPGATRELFAHPHFRTFLLIAFFWLASHGGYDVCISLHLRDLGASGTAIGASWAIGTGFEIVLMAFGSRLLTRFTAARLLSIGLAAMVVRWGLYAAIPHLGVILALQGLHALSFALVWLAGLEFIRESAPPHILATAQGGFSAVASLGSGLSMLMWGPLYEGCGGRGVFTVAALLAGVAFGASLRLLRLMR